MCVSQVTKVHSRYVNWKSFLFQQEKPNLQLISYRLEKVKIYHFCLGDLFLGKILCPGTLILTILKNVFWSPYRYTKEGFSAPSFFKGSFSPRALIVGLQLLKSIRIRIRILVRIQMLKSIRIRIQDFTWLAFYQNKFSSIHSFCHKFLFRPSWLSGSNQSTGMRPIINTIKDL
jgi:hypothetical protein